MYPELFEIGGRLVPSYYVLNALASLAGFLVLLHNLKGAAPQTKKSVLIFAALIFIPFVAGARLGAEFENFFFKKQSCISFSLKGPVSLWWGAALAALFSLPISKLLKTGAQETSDYFAPSMALGGSISKIGCLLNGCCFGKEAHGPCSFGVYYPHGSYAESIFGSLPSYPVQLFESAAWFLIFIFIMLYSKKRAFKGELFLLTVLFYSIARFFSDFFRYTESTSLISYSQVITLIAAFSLFSVWIIRKKLNAPGKTC